MKKILVSVGDISGINSFLIYSAAKKYKDMIFEISAPKNVFNENLRYFKIKNLPSNLIFDYFSESFKKIVPGKPTMNSTLLSYDSFKFSIQKMKRDHKNYAGLLTMPVNKEEISKIEKGFTGHTDFFEKEFDKKLTMLLYSKKIAVLPLTKHISLKEVEKKLFNEKIEDQIDNVYEFFKNFFKTTPNFLFLCVNPHCSDGRLLGLSDIKLKRIVKNLSKKYKIDGPMPADSAFSEENIKSYDVFVGTYHDQVLIPFKMLSFKDGINITCGLPFLRVSPDHGPAYDLVLKFDRITTYSTFSAVQLLSKVRISQK